MRKNVFTIIVTHIGERWIKDTIQSLFKSIYSCSIVVVDNVSSDKTLKILSEFKEIKLIENQLNLGRVEEAKRSFQRAIKLDPKEVKPHVSLADLYFEQGNFVYAALSYSDAVYLDPDNSDYRYMQGLSYFNAQEWGRTASSWED